MRYILGISMVIPYTMLLFIDTVNFYQAATAVMMAALGLGILFLNVTKRNKKN